MKKYSVNKYFGHFWQNYTIEAESKEDAWNRAEKDGNLFFQNVYREPMDLESKGYVVDLEENKKNIPDGSYYDKYYDKEILAEDYQPYFSFNN